MNNYVYQEYFRMNDAIRFLDNSMRFSINKSRKLCPVTQLFVSSESTYSDYSVYLLSVSRRSELCWIKQFANWTSGFQTYFLPTSRVIGCIHFHIPRQTEPNRSLRMLNRVTMRLDISNLQQMMSINFLKRQFA